MPVRNATTAMGENPPKMACFPKMGASPKKIADIMAAWRPLFFPEEFILLPQKGPDFVYQVIAEKIAFLHQ